MVTRWADIVLQTAKSTKVSSTDTGDQVEWGVPHNFDAALSVPTKMMPWDLLAPESSRADFTMARDATTDAWHDE